MIWGVASVIAGIYCISGYLIKNMDSYVVFKAILGVFFIVLGILTIVNYYLF